MHIKYVDVMGRMNNLEECGGSHNQDNSQGFEPRIEMQFEKSAQV